LKGLGLWEKIQPKIRLTRTVNEAYQNTQNNQTEAGFIGLAQYLSSLDNLGTTYWIVPQYLYQPLTQGAVILSSTQHLVAAQAFLEFLQHSNSLKIIREFGFRTLSQFAGEQQDD
jgi:molybdate transport system substrate-binding protein